MAAEGVGIGLGILELLNMRMESNSNLVYIVIVVSIVQSVLYFSFLYIRDNIYKSVLLQWVKTHEVELRDQFFKEKVIHSIVDQRTGDISIKLDRLIYAFVFMSCFFGGIQLLQWQKTYPSPELSWEQVVDRAYLLKVNRLQQKISNFEKSTEAICTVTPEESCGDNILLDKAVKELAELEKYSGKNILLPGEMFRLLSIEIAKQKAEDLNIRSALDAETSARQAEDARLWSGIESFPQPVPPDFSKVWSALQTETSERKGEDASIRSVLDTEASKRQVEDKLLWSTLDSIRTGPGTLRISDSWILQEEGAGEVALRRLGPDYTGPDTSVVFSPDMGNMIDFRGGALYVDNINILSALQKETSERETEDSNISSLLNPLSSEHQAIAAQSAMIWTGPFDSIPSGWRLCDGENGTMMDLRGRFLVGAGGGGYNRADSGGQNSVKLKIDNLPKHNHENTGDFRYLMQSNKGCTVSACDPVGDEPHLQTIMPLLPQGNDEPFDIRPPYMAVYFICHTH